MCEYVQICCEKRKEKKKKRKKKKEKRLLDRNLLMCRLTNAWRETLFCRVLHTKQETCVSTKNFSGIFLGKKRASAGEQSCADVRPECIHFALIDEVLIFRSLLAHRKIF